MCFFVPVVLGEVFRQEMAGDVLEMACENRDPHWEFFEKVTNVLGF